MRAAQEDYYMSAGSNELVSASHESTGPPYSVQEVALSDWPSRVKTAWQTFQAVKQGDMVLWGERSQPLTVTDIRTLEKQQKNVHVEGPRGGTYTLRERYDDQGNPRFYADDSKAMDLRLVTADTEELRPFTEQMYESVVNNLQRAAINNYVQNEVESWNASVKQVVQSWISDIEFQRWSGWPHEWQDDDPQRIYQSILEHSGRLPELVDEQVPEGETTSPKEQARNILEEEITERGRQMAHERLITDNEDYRAIVMQLADDAIDADDLKAHLDARQATQSVVEDFISAHTEPLWRSIIQNAEREPDDIDLYADLDPQDVTREIAFDILDADVWDRARELHEERGTHDPTIRGLAFFEYDKLVERLVEDTLREHRLNDNRRIFTTARQVVKEFLDNVENKNWPYDFAGVDDQTWGAGDVEDIFTSISMHDENDPKIFNPYSADKEKKMAAQVLTETVHQRASDALDDDQRAETKPIPADQYLEDELGTDMTFNEIRDDMDLGPEDFIRTALDNFDDDVELAGWTFVDELVEKLGATVPYISDQWVLVDYGLVASNDRERSIAWFNRSNGSVLVLYGKTDARPADGEYGFEDSWHIQLITWDGPDEPRYLQSDVSLEYAWEFLREYIGANGNDIVVYETTDGEHYIQESIEEDDINTTPFSTGIAPDFDTPGPGFTVEDTLATGSIAFERFSEWVFSNSRLLNTMKFTAVSLALAEIPHLMFRYVPGITVEPDFHKKYGPGIKMGAEFGQDSDSLDEYDPEDPDSKFYTGRIDGSVRITPGFIRFGVSQATPDWLYQVGPDKTIIANIQRNIERPIRQRSGDLLRNPRVAFLGAHVPPTPRGRPQHADDYEEGGSVSLKNADGRKNYAPYILDKNPSEGRVNTHDVPTVKHFLSRLARHGFVAGNGYWWKGDDDLQALLGISEPDYKEALSPTEIQELSWSLKRSYFLGRDGQTFFGDAETVEENHPVDENDTVEPICTNRAILRIWTDLDGTPNTTVISTVWEFYKARARDTDQMTLLDAYDRYRMGIVYDAIERAASIETARHISELNTTNRGMDLQGAFERTNRKEYHWNATGPLRANEVFDDPSQQNIGPWLIFGSEEDARPHPGIGHYYLDDDGQYYQHIPEDDGDFRTVEYTHGAKDNSNDNYNTPHPLNTYQDVFSALLESEQTKIATKIKNSYLTKVVIEEKEFVPGEMPEDDRTWIEADEVERIRRAAAGTVSWDELDGTDLSIFGLFVRGLNTQKAASLADHWNLSDRFRFRLQDVLPSPNFDERASVPSFDEWLDRRRGRNAIGSASEKARSKARYLREIAGTVTPSPTSRDFIGASSGALDDSQRAREIRDFQEETDYTNFEQFYGEEFGEAFDDVAEKFNEMEPAGNAEWNVDVQPNED